MTTNYQTIPLIFLQNSAGTNIAYLAVYHSEGATNQWRFYYLTGASTTSTIWGSISADTWYLVEIYAKIDGSTGAYKVWIDESLDKDLSGLDTDNNGNVARYLIGSTYATEAVYNMDDIAISDAYVGPISSGEEYSFTLEETVNITLNTYTQKSLYRTSSETTTITTTLGTNKNIHFVSGELLETLTVSSNLYPQKAIYVNLFGSTQTVDITSLLDEILPIQYATKGFVFSVIVICALIFGIIGSVFYMLMMQKR
jgi:hypothetical protein